MRTLPLLFLLACAASAAGAVPARILAGPPDERHLPTFTALDVTDGVHVSVHYGAQERVTVKASSASLQAKIKTVVTDHVLHVFFDASDDPTWKGLVGSTEVFTVSVTLPTWQAVHGAKGAVITLPETAPAPAEQAVELRSGASLRGAVAAQTLRVQLRSGATAYLRGRVSQLTVRVTEGSAFESPSLQVANCSAFAASASQVQLQVTDSLEATSLNEAVIAYTGGGRVTSSREEQGGKIHHL